MPNSNLSSPAVGMSLEELTNLMFQYYRELQYLLNGQLDTDNVREITTDKLVAGTAKIDTALIVDLVVGGNVTMGPSAAISWSKVTDKPTIITTDDALTAWANSNYATYIDANGVYTGTVAANKIIIGGESGSISFNDLSDKPSIPTQYYDSDALTAWANSNYATYIDANGVYTGTVAANKIIIGGESGSISFNDLSDKPSIPTQYYDSDALTAWANSNYATYIDANGIYTGSLTALQVNAVDISADSIKTGTLTGITIIGGVIKTSADGERIEIDDANRIHFKDSEGATRGIVKLESGYLKIGSLTYPIKIESMAANMSIGCTLGGITYASGNWNFYGATVSGLTVPAVFS